MKSALIVKIVCVLLLCAIVGNANQGILRLHLAGSVFAIGISQEFDRYLLGLNEATGDFEILFPELNNLKAITCSPSGTLFFSNYPTRENNEAIPMELWRLNFDEGVPRLLLRYETQTNDLLDILFGPSGDLFYLTNLNGDDQTDRGLWRVPNILHAKLGFVVPSRIITPDSFTDFISANSGARIGDFLKTGPYAGDLLIVDSADQTYYAGGRILRAIAPDFMETEVFIEPFGMDRGPVQPASLAVNQEGNVFFSDFTNGIIHIFDDRGQRIGVLNEFPSVNHMAIGPDNILYASNTGFYRDPVGVAPGYMDLYDTENETYINTLWHDDLGIHDIAVCGADLTLPISDQDADGVPDYEDYCPDFPGDPAANGC